MSTTKSEAGGTSTEEGSELDITTETEVCFGSEVAHTSHHQATQPDPLPAHPTNTHAHAQDLLKAVVALKQLQKENKKLAGNFDNVSHVQFCCVAGVQAIGGTKTTAQLTRCCLVLPAACSSSQSTWSCSAATSSLRQTSTASSRSG